jgi:hypothetical protein
VKEKLESEDERVQLEAVNVWMKANGKYTPSKGDVINNITAENVVQQILQGNVDVPDK